MTQPSPAAPSPSARPGRGLRIALAVSVALNLAVVGVVAGAVLRGGPPGRAEVSVRDIGFGPYSRILAPEDRAELRRAFMQRAPDLRRARGQMRQDMAAMAAALRAEPFDSAGLVVVMDRATARTAEMVTLGQSLLVERINAMTPAQRQALADRLEEDNRRGPRAARENPGR